jgi:hypothetical protein
MTNKDMDAIAFYRIAYSYGKQKIKNREDAEDFRAYAVECWLKYGGKGEVKKIYVDWLRKKFGRRFNFVRNEMDNAIAVNFDEIEDVKEKIFDFSEIFLFLPIADTIILNLTVKWGFTAQEIAEVFGVTEGRISQVRKLVRERIRRIPPD